MQNFITLGQPLLGEKYVEEKEIRKRKKNNGHFIPLQRLSAAHALHSDQYFFSAMMKMKISL